MDTEARAADAILDASVRVQDQANREAAYRARNRHRATIVAEVAEAAGWWRDFDISTELPTVKRWWPKQQEAA